MLDLRNSCTYWGIFVEGWAKARAIGELEAAREVLFWAARKELGPPDAKSRAAVEAVTDASDLFTLTARVFDVSTWAELLAEPPPQ